MGVFNGNNGGLSSKRVIGACLLFWFASASSWYFLRISGGMKESGTIENILISALGGGVAMITGGVLDGLFNKRTSIPTEKEIKKDK